MIKVLREGVHGNHYYKGYAVYDPICSSTTLIQAGGKNIVVDPGHLARKEELKTLLEKEKLQPNNIDFVFITHHHLDHASNMGSFPKAKIFIGGGWIDHQQPHYTVYENPAIMELPPALEIIPTPGHTPESMSLLYQEDNLTYLCGGDAVREDLIRELHAQKSATTAQKNDQTKNSLEYISSLKKIFQLADVIIPGHGRIIKENLKQELQILVEKL